MPEQLEMTVSMHLWLFEFISMETRDLHITLVVPVPPNAGLIGTSILFLKDDLNRIHEVDAAAQVLIATTPFRNDRSQTVETRICNVSDALG